MVAAEGDGALVIVAIENDRRELDSALKLRRHLLDVLLINRIS